MGTAVQGVEIGFNCHSNGTEKGFETTCIETSLDRSDLQLMKISALAL